MMTLYCNLLGTYLSQDATTSLGLKPLQPFANFQAEACLKSNVVHREIASLDQMPAQPAHQQTSLA